MTRCVAWPASGRGALVLVVVLGALGASPASATVRSFTARIDTPTQAHPGPNDPDRCVAYAFASFPDVARATRHVLSYFDGLTRESVTKALRPPFDDVFTWFPARFAVGPGRHWAALAGASTGAGCGAAREPLTGRFSDARVIMRILHRGPGFEGMILDATCRPVRRRIQLTARAGKRDEPLPHQDILARAFSHKGEYELDLSRRPRASEVLTITATGYADGPKVAFKGTPDLHTAVHEAAHIVQQRAGVTLSTAGPCQQVP